MIFSRWMGAAAVMVAALGAGAADAAPECVGINLIDQLPTEKRQQIEAATADIPYHQGILWRATRGDARITLVGTYHFGDPRHQATLDAIEGDMAKAGALFVEAGPDEEAKLTAALAEDPTLMVTTDGPTLVERLDPEEWQTLSAAMSERGMPDMLTSKLRPWYVAMMLGISPCMMKGLTETGETGGLDHLLIEKAEVMDVPVRALEPWDTVLDLFDSLTPQQELDMIRSTLPAAKYADDYAVTLTDAYFRGDVWAIWEFGRFDAYENSGMTKEAVDEQMVLGQRLLMDDRNSRWITPLTRAADEAAAKGETIVAGFGALHLPGEGGVLRLLEKDGWKIEPLVP